jgi:hypothetical protein
VPRTCQHHVDLAAGETQRIKIKGQVGGGERVQLDPQQVDVPSGVLGDLVVGQAQCSLLVF